MEQDFNDKWEFYKDVDTKWRWRRTSPNGNIVGASTEGYINKTDCEGNASRNGWNGEADYPQGEDTTKQDELTAHNAAQSKAYDLYMEQGARDGAANADQRAEDRRSDNRFRALYTKQTTNMLLVIAGILSVIVVILLFQVFRDTVPVLVSGPADSQPRIIVLAMNPVEDEKVVVFSDTHFDYDQYTLSQDAKTLLDGNVQSLKENPKLHVRLAGYTSAKGTEEVNQALSEQRANAVRDYLVEEGIAAERITVVGYGRTRPALFEVAPGDRQSEEAMANMRVLFEVVVK